MPIMESMGLITAVAIAWPLRLRVLGCCTLPGGEAPAGALAADVADRQALSHADLGAA